MLADHGLSKWLANILYPLVSWNLVMVWGNFAPSIRRWNLLWHWRTPTGIQHKVNSCKRGLHNSHGIRLATLGNPLQISHACHVVGNSCKTLTFYVLLTSFDQVQNPWRLPGDTTSERPTVSEHVVSYAFSVPNAFCATTACTFSTSPLPKVLREWCKCASRHSGALFWHLHFQKCSVLDVFLAFWLGKVLLATMACSFSSLISQMAPHPPL